MLGKGQSLDTWCEPATEQKTELMTTLKKPSAKITGKF